MFVTSNTRTNFFFWQYFFTFEYLKLQHCDWSWMRHFKLCLTINAAFWELANYNALFIHYLNALPCQNHSKWQAISWHWQCFALSTEKQLEGQGKYQCLTVLQSLLVYFMGKQICFLLAAGYLGNTQRTDVCFGPLLRRRIVLNPSVIFLTKTMLNNYDRLPVFQVEVI